MPSNDVYDLVYDYDTDLSVYGNVFALVDLILRTTLEEALGVFCNTPVDVFSNSIVDTNR